MAKDFESHGKIRTHTILSIPPLFILRLYTFQEESDKFDFPIIWEKSHFDLRDDDQN